MKGLVLFLAPLFAFVNSCCAQAENRSYNDSLIYLKEVKAFLNQVVRDKISYKKTKSIIEENVVDVEILGAMSDSLFFTKPKKDSIKAFTQNPFIRKWTNVFFPDKRIVPNDSVKLVFQGKGWEDFYKKYGSSVCSFSAPVFIRNYTYCIFYQGNSCGLLCGSGWTALYQKINGKWKQIKTYNGWIS